VSLVHGALEGSDRSQSVVQDSGDERSVRSSNFDGIAHMCGISRTARCNHGNRHSIGNGSRELEVIAASHAVSINAREQNLAGAAFCALARPRDGVARSRLATALHEDAIRPVHLGGVDACDNALSAIAVRGLRQNFRAFDGARVE
jgi:hypothetical protein